MQTIKRSLCVIGLLTGVLIFAVFAASCPVSAAPALPAVSDGAAFLGAEQTEEIIALLDEFHASYGAYAWIVTEYSLPNDDEQAAANAALDTIEAAFAAEETDTDAAHLLLYVSREPRAYYLLASAGFGNAETIDDALIYIEDAILDDLRAGDYAEAFRAFAAGAGNVMRGNFPHEAENENNSLPTYPEPDFRNDWYTSEPVIQGGTVAGRFRAAFADGNGWILLAAVILVPLAVAFFLTGLKLKQMNTVGGQKRADSYTGANGLQLEASRDIFLYSNLIRRPRPKQNPPSSSAGSPHGGMSRSPSHHSSSGRVGRGGRL